jgi:hypothetical protein
MKLKAAACSAAHACAAHAHHPAAAAGLNSCVGLPQPCVPHRSASWRGCHIPHAPRGGGKGSGRQALYNLVTMDVVQATWQVHIQNQKASNHTT